jgi:uncharacterized membrane protein YkvA (DUF1232 family)
VWQRLKRWAERLRRDSLTLWIAIGDKRTPLWLRLLGFVIIAYALSPIDLIPDFLPVVGYLDELILLPVALWILIRFMPADVLADARIRAEQRIADGQKRPRSLLGAIIVIVIWITVAWWIVSLFARPAIA